MHRRRWIVVVGMMIMVLGWNTTTFARFLQRDPLGEAGGMNLYAFVGNNPVNWIDPWGLKLVPAGTPEQISIIERHLNRLRKNSPTANSLIQILDDDEAVIEIYLKPMNTFNPASNEVTYCGEYSDGVIQWGGRQPWQAAPPEIFLAHELIHALHHVVWGKETPNIWDQLLDMINLSKEEEEWTVGTGRYKHHKFTENTIRIEYPSHYGLVPEPPY